MRKIRTLTFLGVLLSFTFSLLLSSCNRGVPCPTGYLEAKELSAGASNGRGTEKKRTQNGLIKQKKPKVLSKKNR